jgi:DNA mismatch endonuclease, patch repair protein
MPDVHSKEIRTKNMRAIRSAKTSSEDLLAKLIWKAGYRYRRNDKTVFGKPDLTFKKCKVAVFCDGEFWHGKDWAKKRKKISQNQAYWIPKIGRNMQRDKLVDQKLREEGWRVIRFWHQEIKKDPQECAQKVIDLLVT